MVRDLFTPTHIIIIALIVFLVMGSRKAPDIARNLGRSARIIKTEADEFKQEFKKEPGTTSQASTSAGEVITPMSSANGSTPVTEAPRGTEETSA